MFSLLLIPSTITFSSTIYSQTLDQSELWAAEAAHQKLAFFQFWAAEAAHQKFAFFQFWAAEAAHPLLI